MNKRLISIGIFCFAFAILFGLIFTWTFDVSTTAYYVNIIGVGLVMRDFDPISENPQVIYAVISIIFIFLGTLLTILGVNSKNKEN